MSDSFVTVATFQDPMAATLAKNYLEAQGIPGILLDESTIAMDWVLSSAIGGVKLQVAPIHLERAKVLLKERQPEEHAEPPPPETAIASQEVAEELQAEREDKAEINKTADKLFRTAVFGFLFWPLQLYAIYLMLAILGTEGKVAPNRRWKVWVSVLMNMPIMSIVVVPILFMIGSCDSKPEGPEHPVWRRRHLDLAGVSVKMPHEPWYQRGEHAGGTMHEWSALAKGREYRVSYFPSAAAKGAEENVLRDWSKRVPWNSELVKDERIEVAEFPARECVVQHPAVFERSQIFVRGQSMIVLSALGTKSDIDSDEAAQFFKSIRLK